MFDDIVNWVLRGKLQQLKNGKNLCTQCNNLAMSRLRLLETFVAIVNAGSLSGAARQLGYSVAATSRHLAELEDQTQSRLIDRTTRTLKMSSAGERLYPHAVAALSAVNEALHSAMPAGLNATVRLSVPVALGLRIVVPAISILMAKNPQLEVELLLEDRSAAAMREGVDVLVRAGFAPISDSSDLVIRPLGTYSLTLCASPAFLSRYPAPQHPDEVAQLPLLGHLGFRAHPVLTFSRDSVQVDVAFKSRYWINDLLALHRAASDGAGATVLPTLMVLGRSRKDHLQALLPEWSLPTGGVWIAWRQKTHNKLAVKLVVDHLKAAFAVHGVDPAPILQSGGLHSPCERPAP